jgi:Sigma-70 region 2
VPDPDQAELVNAARQGDKQALAALIIRHRPMLVAVCRGALGDSQLAEDAAQEALGRPAADPPVPSAGRRRSGRGVVDSRLCAPRRGATTCVP